MDDADSHKAAPVVVASARGAGRVLGAATCIGLLVQLLFWDVGWGVNFPLAVSALLVAGWLCRDRALPAPRLLDAWIPFAALGLAAFVAIRGDVALVTLDVLGALALTGGAIASFGGLRVVERPFSRVLALGVRVAGWAMTGGRRALAAGANALPPGRARSALARHAPLIRGIALAIPAVLVFALLFMAADAVFAQLTTDLFDWDLDLGDAGGRLFLAAVVAWLAAGLIAAVAWPRASDAPLEEAPFAGRRRLGATESAVILIALDVLFAIFVIIQAAYLFGGLDTLAASGMTYAEYARRGFFELLVVAFLVAGLILALEYLISVRTRVYVGAAVVLVILTMVVLASSFLRLRLYQDAYGWTELRFYVVAAIGWLALGTVATIWTLVQDQTRWLPHVMVFLAVLFGIGFNLIGPVKFIAEQNVARAVHPELVPPGGEPGLDAWYLSGLGTDADIVLVEALPDLPPAEQDEVRSVLEVSADQLETDVAGQAWQAWNASRERARALLVE